MYTFIPHRLVYFKCLFLLILMIITDNSPVPPFFCEKLRSGDAGERDNVSASEMGSGSCVSGGYKMLSRLS